MEVAQLRNLSNSEIKQLVPVEGHKRRLVSRAHPRERGLLSPLTLRPRAHPLSHSRPPRCVCSRQLLALNELTPIEGVTPVAERAPVAPAPKYNSTSSLYIDSTITRPCIDEIIFCVSIVIHDRVEEGKRQRHSLRSSRSVTIPLALRAAPVSYLSPSAGERELQANPTMMDRLPSMFNTKSKPLLVQLGASAAPTEDTIFQAIKSIYSIAEFSRKRKRRPTNSHAPLPPQSSHRPLGCSRQPSASSSLCCTLSDYVRSPGCTSS